MKCKECKFFRPNHEWQVQGYGDCDNKKVRHGEKALIWIKYCMEFSLSEDFGCIYAEEKEDNHVQTDEGKRWYLDIEAKEEQPT